MSLKFRKFVQLTKVDEAKREVGGIVTAEFPDKEGEICHYESTVPYYKAWSEELSKATEGKNLGNLRLMHTLEAVGVGKSLDFNDDKKEICMTFKVVDDDAWKGVQEGMLTGFSQGGEYVKAWTEKGQKYYTAKPSEVSLVDNPCLATAHFEFIRADGTSELRKFKKVEPEDMKKEEIIELVESLLKAKKKPEVEKDDEMTEAKKAREAKLKATVAEFIKTRAGLKKNMYDVASFSYLLCDLAYIMFSARYEAEYEGDGSELPAKLAVELGNLIDCFLEMAEEEANELLGKAAVVQTADTSKGGSSIVKTQVPAEVAQAITDLVKLNAAHNASVEGLLKKILGAEEAQIMGNDEPKPKDPKGNTEDVSDAASRGAVKALTHADLDKAVAEAVEKTRKATEESMEAGFQEILKALSDDQNAEQDDDSKDKGKKKAAPAAGIGDRSQVVVAGGGPAIKVMPVHKADEVTQAPPVAESFDVSKALAGDASEQLKMMKSATPQADLPATVAQAMGSRKR